MKIKSILDKNLVALSLVFAAGCGSANANRNESGLTRQTYTLEYDEVPVQLAMVMYGMEHPGATEVSAQDLNPYFWSPRDVNNNGILDCRREVTITRRGDVIVELYDRFITHAAASPTHREEVTEKRFERRDDGYYVQTTRGLTNDNQEQLMGTWFSHFEDGSFAREMQHAGVLLRNIQRPQQPSNNQNPNQL